MDGSVKIREEGKAGMNLTFVKPSRWLLGDVGFSLINVIHAHRGKHKQGNSSKKGAGI